uniref:Uncharacterized protein n=1 Tax=Arundo donax TaxID=35708 RepID=A0A0A9F9F3_ARUDO
MHNPTLLLPSSIYCLLHGFGPALIDKDLKYELA